MIGFRFSILAKLEYLGKFKDILIIAPMQRFEVSVFNSKTYTGNVPIITNS